MLKLKSGSWYALLLLAILGGCRDKEEVDPANSNNANAATNRTFYNYMKEWYLWYDKMPVVNPNDYPEPEELLEVLRYKTLDRFSYVEKAATFQQFFEEGKSVGYGFLPVYDQDNNLRVAQVYKDSPMGKAGVDRGYKIQKINGRNVNDMTAETLGDILFEEKAGVQTAFQVVDPAGNAKGVTVTTASFNLNTVLYRNVYEVGGRKVGYLVFTAFIQKSVNELNDAFTWFKSQGVNELIVDLRYNGGGSVAVSQHLAGLISGPKAAGKVFVQYTFNDKKTEENIAINIESKAQSLNLDRVVIITGRRTASASEALVNGLRPFMPALTVGGTSYGKPVGMIPEEAGGYTIVPIMFKVANANGESDYFEGIKADGPASDDVSLPFGDPKEARLQQALYYIQNGSFTSTLATGRRGVAENKQVLPMNGFRAEVGVF